MGFDMNVEFLRMAFWQIVMVAGPVLLVSAWDRFVYRHHSGGNIDQ